MRATTARRSPPTGGGSRRSWTRAAKYCDRAAGARARATRPGRGAAGEESGSPSSEAVSRSLPRRLDRIRKTAGRLDYSRRNAPFRGGTTGDQHFDSEDPLPKVGVVGFDERLSAGRTRIVPIACVVDPLPYSHAPERVEEYRRAMVAGQLFPPICVLPFGRRFFIADGHKRFSAYSPLAGERILVEVWSVGRWLKDQAGQLRRNVTKNRMILRAVVRDRREAKRLILTTVGHWNRVARCLLMRRSNPN